MAKKQVIVTHPNFDDDENFTYNQTTYPDDHDAQLHNNGALIIVEYGPDLLSTDGTSTKKANLVAIYQEGSWVKVEVK